MPKPAKGKKRKSSKEAAPLPPLPATAAEAGEEAVADDEDIDFFTLPPASRARTSSGVPGSLCATSSSTAIASLTVPAGAVVAAAADPAVVGTSEDWQSPAVRAQAERALAMQYAQAHAAAEQARYAREAYAMQQAAYSAQQAAQAAALARARAPKRGGAGAGALGLAGLAAYGSSDSDSDDGGTGSANAVAAGNTSSSSAMAVAPAPVAAVTVVDPVAAAPWVAWVEVRSGGRSAEQEQPQQQPPYFHNGASGASSWEMPGEVRHQRECGAVDAAELAPFVLLPNAVRVAGVPWSQDFDTELGAPRLQRARTAWLQRRDGGGGGGGDAGEGGDGEGGLAELLVSFFGECGPIASVEVCSAAAGQSGGGGGGAHHSEDGGGSTCGAIVRFGSEAATEAALRLDGRRLFGWQSKFSDDELLAAAGDKKSGDPIADAHLAAATAAAKAARRSFSERLVKKHNHIIRARRYWAKDRRWLTGAGRVFVSGFALGTTDEQLRDLFASCGPVRRVRRVAARPDNGGGARRQQQQQQQQQQQWGELPRGRAEGRAVIQFGGSGRQSEEEGGEAAAAPSTTDAGDEEDVVGVLESAALAALRLNGTPLGGGARLAVGVSCRRCWRDSDVSADAGAGVGGGRQPLPQPGHAGRSGGGGGKEQGAGKRPEGCMTLFVGNIPFNTEEEDIKAALISAASGASAGSWESVGSATEAGVREVRLVHDKDTRKFRGFVFVECTSEEALTRLAALNGERRFGRELRVRFASKDR